MAAIAPLGSVGEPAFKNLSLIQSEVPSKSPVPQVKETATGNIKPFERLLILEVDHPLIPQ